MIQDKAYPHFYENQVLSEGHLNSLVQYLELEDRESRIVDGSGIRCGFNVTLHDNSTVIKLSPGVGTTTKGYLVKNLSTKSYRFYQALNLPEESKHNYLSANGVTFKLYELLETNVDPYDPSELNKQAHALGETLKPGPDESISLASMAVILHLEIVSADLTTCKIDSCDNEGFEYQLKWRSLLIAKNDLKALLKEDLGISGTADEHFLSKYKIHEARIMVPKFDCRNTTAYAQIHRNYLYVCKLGAAHLHETFVKVQAAYKRILPDLAIKFDDQILADNLRFYEEKDDAGGIQYFYDHLKDVALALNEFAGAAFEYHFSSSLDQERYPNYLMAGSLRTEDYNDLPDDLFRHYFKPYCRDTASTNARKELINLYKRVNELIASYTLDFVAKSSEFESTKDRLFIAPESRHTNKLGDRVPPYYYGNPSAVLLRWNTELFSRRFSQDLPYYWARKNGDNETADWALDDESALRFRLDSHNCYHVEGHVGMTKSDFEDAFLKLKERFNLDIDLKILEAKHVDDFNHEEPYQMLRELLEMYNIEKKQIDCYLTKIFDSLKDEYTVESVRDDTVDPTLPMLQKCVDKLTEAYKQIVKKLNLNSEYYRREQIDEIINSLDLRCPSDKKKPSFYTVDLAAVDEAFKKMGGVFRVDTDPPLLIEHSDHHGGYANVLYTNGEVDTLETAGTAYRTLVDKYVLEETERSTVGAGEESPFDRLRIVLGKEEGKIKGEDTIAAENEIGAEASDKGRTVKAVGMTEAEAKRTAGETGIAVEKPVAYRTKGVAGYSKMMSEAKAAREMLGAESPQSAVEFVSQMMAEATNDLQAEQLKNVRDVIIAGWVGSATGGEIDEVSLSQITVVDKKKSYTFFEYNHSVAIALGAADGIRQLLSMLAQLIYKMRSAVNEDNIEEPETSIAAYLDDLNELSQIIADRLDQYAPIIDEDEIEIRKSLLLPIITALYQFCWAGNFVNIKKRYVEVKKNILEERALPHFVYDHPGIRHLGGVPVGGTFVAVFKAYDETSLYKDFKNVVLGGAWKGYTSTVLRDYEKYVRELGQGLVEVRGPRQEVIVADFCLPYRCSADTTNVEYVVFVELQLDFPKEVCNETARVPIRFSPNVAVPSGEHVVFDEEDGRYYFNSGGLDAGVYEILLSLSDRNLKKNITVFEHPSAAYTVAPEKPNPAIGENEWNFQAEESGVIYSWYRRDLAEDDEIFETVDDTVINDNDFVRVGLSRAYKTVVEPETRLDFELVLLVVNGPCRVYSKPRRFTFVPAIKWSVSPTVFCNGLDKVALTPFPADAVITGLGELQEKVGLLQGRYVIFAKDIPQNEYKLRLALGEDLFEILLIRILQTPAAVFRLDNEEPIPLKNGYYRWVFVIKGDNENYEYQWYFEGEALPGQTGITYNHDWDPKTGTSGKLELRATNRWGDDTCTNASILEIEYPPVVEPKGVITGPKQVCADSVATPIEYAAEGGVVTIAGEQNSKYVEYSPKTGKAFFNATGLKPDETYPVYLLINDNAVFAFKVKVCASPDTTFIVEERGIDPETKRAYIAFRVAKYDDDCLSEWIVADSVVGEGKGYRHFWKPDVNDSLKIKLRVSSKECTKDSEEREFFNYDGGSLHLDSLAHYLGTTLSIYEGDAKIPADIEEYVEKIISVNREIIEIIKPPTPDVDPREYALSKLDSGNITRRIGSNLEYLNMVLDKLNYLDYSEEERVQIETFIKATAASMAEILLAKSKDIDKTTGAYDYLTNVTPKLTDLFKIDHSLAADPELLKRKKQKVNIGEFIDLVGKLK